MKRLQWVASCLLAFGLLLGKSAQAQSRFTGHVVRVESGDRIVVRLDTWNVTVQLHGITSPTEPDEAAFRAREYTTRRILYTDVQVEVRGTGPHETVYGEVRTYDGKSLNAELVGVGLALWAQTYAPDRGDLERIEIQAQKAHRGIWGVSDGSNVVLPPTPSPSAPVASAMPPQPAAAEPDPLSVASSPPSHKRRRPHKSPPQRSYAAAALLGRQRSHHSPRCEHAGAG